MQFVHSPRGASIFLAALFAAVSLVLAACGEPERSASQSKDAPPAKNAAPVDPAVAAVIAAQGPSYPMTVCPVSGEKLGSHGAPYDHVYEGRLVRFCCDGCLKDFAKDPAFFIARIDSAAAAPATTGG